MLIYIYIYIYTHVYAHIGPLLPDADLGSAEKSRPADRGEPLVSRYSSNAGFLHLLLLLLIVIIVTTCLTPLV